MAGRFFPQRRAGRPLGGVLAAGSLAVLWAGLRHTHRAAGCGGGGGLFPIGAVLLAAGARGSSAGRQPPVLGLLILPDKGVALMYLCFMGLYPW